MIHVRSRSRGWPAAGAVWTPADLTNIHGWWKPESLGADLSLVANWPDQVGSIGDWKQGTEASQPQNHASLVDGYTGFTGDGVDDTLILDTERTVASAAAFSLVFVAKIAGNGDWLFSGSTTNDYLRSDGGGGAERLVIRCGGSSGTQICANGSYSYGTAALFEIYRAATTGAFSVFVNGVDKSAAGPPALTQAFNIQYLLSLHASAFDADSFVELLLSLDTKWSTDEQAALRAYLDSRYPSLSIAVP